MKYYHYIVVLLLALEPSIMAIVLFEKIGKRKCARSITAALYTVAVLITLAAAFLFSWKMQKTTFDSFYIMLLPCVFVSSAIFILYFGSAAKKFSMYFAINLIVFTLSSLSYRLMLLFDTTPIEALCLMAIFQTVLFAFALPPILLAIKKHYRHTAERMRSILDKRFAVSSATWFGTLVIANITMDFCTVKVSSIALLIVLSLGMYLTYMLFYHLASANKNIDDLENKIYIDDLTGLYNRSKMLTDAQALIESKTPFTLIYSDLNYLKSVNDVYGHDAGDRYLRLFSDNGKRLLGDKGKLYRISGDEFVCLFTYSEREANEFMSAFSNLDLWDEAQSDIKYSGCGIGGARYPDEGIAVDKLIGIADVRMYENKQRGKCGR